MDDTKKLIDYLPAVFQKASREKGETPPFIEKFLQIFDEQFNQLDAKVDRIPHLFNPWKTDNEFLPWLASWMDLSLSEEWGERTRRSLLHHIFSIYQIRGTLEGLIAILDIYLGKTVQAIENDSTRPHTFIVTVNFPEFAPAKMAQRTRAIRNVIDREKPAHTDYVWNVLHPTMQINFRSTIGVDTILGTTPNSDFNKKS